MRTTITGKSNISVSRLKKTRNNNRRTNECINEIAERLGKKCWHCINNDRRGGDENGPKNKIRGKKAAPTD